MERYSWLWRTGWRCRQRLFEGLFTIAFNRQASLTKTQQASVVAKLEAGSHKVSHHSMTRRSLRLDTTSCCNSLEQFVKSFATIHARVCWRCMGRVRQVWFQTGVRSSWVTSTAVPIVTVSALTNLKK